MTYTNLSSQRLQKHFNSDDFSFRETSLAVALQAAGLTTQTHLVREPKIEGLLSDHNDYYNERPSRHHIFHVGE